MMRGHRGPPQGSCQKVNSCTMPDGNGEWQFFTGDFDLFPPNNQIMAVAPAEPPTQGTADHCDAQATSANNTEDPILTSSGELASCCPPYPASQGGGDRPSSDVRRGDRPDVDVRPASRSNSKPRSSGGSSSSDDDLAVIKRRKQARNRMAQQRCRARNRSKQAELLAQLQNMSGEVERTRAQNEMLRRENAELRQDVQRLVREKSATEALGISAAAMAGGQGTGVAAGVVVSCAPGAQTCSVIHAGGPPAISPRMQAKLDAVLPPATVVQMALCDAAGQRISLSAESLKNSSVQEMHHTQQMYAREIAKQLTAAISSGQASEAGMRVTALVMEAQLLCFCSSQYARRTHSIIRVLERIAPSCAPDFAGPLTFLDPDQSQLDKLMEAMEGLLNVTPSQKQALYDARRDLITQLQELEGKRAKLVAQLNQVCVSDLRGSKFLEVQHLQQLETMDELAVTFRDGQEAICDALIYICMKVLTPLQCAMAVCQCYPNSVDFLGFINHLARKDGEAMLPAPATNALTERGGLLQGLPTQPFTQVVRATSWPQPIITIKQRSTSA